MQNKGAIRLFAILLTLVSIYQLTFTYVTGRIESKANSFAEEKADAEKSKGLIDSIANSNGDVALIKSCTEKIRKIQMDVLKEKELSFLDSILAANGDMNKIKPYLDSVRNFQDELKNRREKTYLDSISTEPVYNFLWLRNFTYSDCKERELNLGLDLKGGMNVTLEISVVDVIKALAGINAKDTTFVRAMKDAKEMQKESDEDFVQLFAKAIKNIDPDIRLATFFQTSELKNKINWETTDEEVIAILEKEASDAIDNSFNILRKRIDRFGVTQPNIQRLETAGRVLIELPGVKDPDRALKLLQGTAKLEFWETYENNEVFPALRDINDKLVAILAGEEEAKPVKNDNLSKDTTLLADNAKPEKADTTKPAKDTGSLLSSDDKKNDSLNSENLSEEQSREEFMKKNPLFGILTPWVDKNNQLGSGPVVGYALGRDTSKVMRLLNMKQAKAILPTKIKLLWTVKPFDEEGKFYQLIAIRKPKDRSNAPLEGDAITDAYGDYSQSGGQYAVVYMTMNSSGSNEWAELTRNNIGRSIAIVLDNYVYSFPTVNDEITGGQSQITGNFTIQEATDLATLLKSGKLPAPARVESYEIVGPSLGQEAINAGMMSFIVAFLLVMGFMMFYYSYSAGTIANIALVANIFFIFGVLASLNAVLTLAGIAGIVLTVGMSVDANVIIYERIKEEVAAGKGIKLAIKDGYANALSAIIDGNVTTFLSGVVLYYFGSGPIQGFATTLMIGILTTLFSAILLTRLIYEWAFDKNLKLKFDIKLTRNFMKNVNIDFLGKRRIFYVISSIVIGVGLISLAVRGLDFGLDFTGGRTYIVRFENNVNTVDVQKNLSEVFGSNPEVKTYGTDNQVKITTKYKIDEDGVNIDSEIDSLMYIGMKEFLGDMSFKEYVNPTETKVAGKMSSQKVGPTIVDEIKVDAMWAIGLSLIIMFSYIAIRFKTWQFGLGATVALFHDVLFTLGMFSLLYGFLPFPLEIDQAFIAAILTIIGYSVNDTVVIFDRIREWTGLYTKRERKDIINGAINSTISRTINTSLTVLLVLLAMFFFGGESMMGFMFALIIGVISGVYSTIFVASAIVYDTQGKQAKSFVVKSKAATKSESEAETATEA